MSDIAWRELFAALRHQRDLVAAWPVSPPDPSAERCEQSYHRTLAHLRACQEQWLLTAEAFIRQPGVKVIVPHPWRVFETEGYDQIPWEVHMERYLADRERWLQLENEVSPDLGGRWNKKADTIEGLTERLATHEHYHLLLLEQSKPNNDA